ncbi:spidroin-1-like, partial [Uranotaenia lowii]|uniref:spidroin-1-like n=1 Tax=Uranotaenia lowii TaxID=190385 RepID=UPI002478825D
YWGRDPSAMAAAAASNPLFGSQFAMPGGLGGLMPNAAAAAAAAASGSGSDRFPMSHSHPNTMAVAASQAASLAGLHSSWWSMAQLAAQDYFARLQASGMASQLPFPPGADLAGAFPGGLGLGAMSAGAGSPGGAGANGKGGGSGGKAKKRDRSSNSSSSSASSSGINSGTGGANSYKNASSPSVSQAAAAAAYKQSLYSQATLQKELMAITAAAAAAQQNSQQMSSGMGSGGGQSVSSKSKNSGGNSGNGGRNSGSNAGNDILSLSRASSASPSVNSSAKSQPSPSVTISASNIPGSSSLGNHMQNLSRSGKDGGKNNSAADLGLSASMNALSTLSQFGNLDLSTQQNVTATMNALAASSAKAKDYMSSGILNDPSSLLGVRLPPDTEIIKYTSSNIGSKSSGSSSRSAKRARMEANDFGQSPTGTGSLGGNTGIGGGILPGLGSGGSASSSGGTGGNNDRIEVIKLPPTITSNGVYNSTKGKDSIQDSLSDWAGLNLSTKSTSSIASSLAAAAAAVAAASESQDDVPLNLSMKSSKGSDSPAPPSGLGVSASTANSLQSLSTITAALGTSGGSGTGGSDAPRSRRKSNNKNRSSGLSMADGGVSGSGSSLGATSGGGLNSTISSLLLAAGDPSGASTAAGQGGSSSASGAGTAGSAAGGSSAGGVNNHLAAQLGLNSSLSELLKISNYDDYDYAALGGSQFKEGRPRNLGRGVSKPKKNTVASLLAQSRAVGSKPLTAQQLLTQEAEIEKLRQAMIEASQSMDSTSNTNTDTESVAESGMSESEGEEQINVKELRVPLEKGWRRETVIRGLTKNGQIKGDVFYYPPQSMNKMKGMNQVQLYLDQFKPKDLNRDNFSFSAKAIVGTFLQPAPPPYATDGEYIKMTDVEVARRLEELKMFTRHTALGVEQRIEIAKQQQALRDAKKMAKDEISKNKEKARQAKEAERNERLEQQRKERELKNQQALEAKKKREEELARQKAEEAARKQQEKEQKRQQALLQKEQEIAKQKELMYAVEMERERRRQHMALIKQLELRRKFEDKEKKKHQ